MYKVLWRALITSCNKKVIRFINKVVRFNNRKVTDALEYVSEFCEIFVADFLNKSDGG